jgi:hypothetical protein
MSQHCIFFSLHKSLNYQTQPKHCQNKYLSTATAGKKTIKKSFQKEEICKSNAEWTRIGCRDKIIKPRFLPTAIETESQMQPSCFETKPNRFLETIATNHPQLYKQLTKRYPARPKFCPTFKTTYQIDYDHFSEYPQGLYD